MNHICSDGALHRETSLHFPKMVEVSGLPSPYESLCGKYRYRGIEPAAKPHKSLFGSRPTVNRLLSEEPLSVKSTTNASSFTVFPTFEGLEGVGWDSQPNRKVYLFRTLRGRWVISFADEIGKTTPLCWIRSSITAYTPVNVCDESPCYEPEDSESTVPEDAPLSYEYEIAIPEVGFQRCSIQIRPAKILKSRSPRMTDKNKLCRIARADRPELLPQLGSLSPLPFHSHRDRAGDTLRSSDRAAKAVESPGLYSAKKQKISPRNKQGSLPDVLESPRINYLFDVLSMPSPRSLGESFGTVGHHRAKASTLTTKTEENLTGKSSSKNLDNGIKRPPRRKACGKCTACLAPDCGECACCINKKRKKKCVNRRCVVLKEALRVERQKRRQLKRQRKLNAQKFLRMNAKRVKPTDDSHCTNAPETV